MGSDASALLGTYNVTSLRRIARIQQIDVKATSREQVAEALALALAAPDRIQQSVDSLGFTERALFDELILVGGDATTAEMCRRLVSKGLVQDDRATHAHPAPTQKMVLEALLPSFNDVVSRLGTLGLVFTSNGDSPNSTLLDLARPSERLVVPDAVRQQVPAPRLPVQTVAEPDDVIVADPAATVRDVYVVLSAATREPIPLTTRLQIQKRSIVRLMQSFRQPEDVAAARSEDDLFRLPLLRILAEEMNLLTVRAGTLAAGNDLIAFLDRSRAERIAALYRAYCATSRWCEIFKLPGVSVRSRNGLGRAAPDEIIHARQRVIAEIRKLPAGSWVSLDHLADRLRRQDYEFLLRRTSAPGYYGSRLYGIGNPYDGSNDCGWIFEPPLDESEGWDKVEKRFIWTVIEVLHQLGLLAIGMLANGNDAVQVTSFGDRILRGETADDESPAPRVVIQPNFQIFAFETTNESVLFRLDVFADQVRAEQVVEYHISRESVYRGQLHGASAAMIIAYLERVSEVPLPQNVRRTIEEWGTQVERLVVRQHVSLVRAKDAATLDALYGDAETRTLLGKRIAPTVALVAWIDLPKIYARLLQMGQIPALAEGLNSPTSRSVTVDADGRITFLPQTPNLFVLHKLSRFSTPDHNGQLRLTADSLRAAAEEKLTAADIILAIESHHAGRLAPDVATLIERCTKNVGRGSLIEATLLQVEDAATLSSLLTDPEIGPHLRPIPGAATFAIVVRSGLSQVRSVLTARGMPLTNTPLHP